MAKLHKAHSKFTISGRLSKKLLGKETYDQMHPIGTAAVAAAEPPPTPPPPAPLPDEEEIRRTKRRSGQMRRSGRSSTILSESDTLGP
jgi:hypothetical protein